MEAYICTSDLVLPRLDGVVGGGWLVGVFGSSGHGDVVLGVSALEN